MSPFPTDSPFLLGAVEKTPSPAFGIVDSAITRSHWIGGIYVWSALNEGQKEATEEDADNELVEGKHDNDDKELVSKKVPVEEEFRNLLI